MKQLIHDLGRLLSAPGSEGVRIQRAADRLGTFVEGKPTLDSQFTQPQ